MSLAAYLPTTPTLSHAKSKTVEVTSVQALTATDKKPDALLRWRGRRWHADSRNRRVREGPGDRDPAGRQPDRAAHDPGPAAPGTAGKSRDDLRAGRPGDLLLRMDDPPDGTRRGRPQAADRQEPADGLRRDRPRRDRRVPGPGPRRHQARLVAQLRRRAAVLVPRRRRPGGISRPDPCLPAAGRARA